MTFLKSYKLGEIAEDVSYGYTESANWKPIGPKFLRITDIQFDHIDWSSVPYCKISNSDFKKYKLEVGDIVVARTGNSTGATSTIKNNVDAVFASYLIRFRLDKSLANPFYVDFVLRSNQWNNFIDSIKGGSAQPGANAKQLAEFEISLPDLNAQNRIASILSSLDDKIELNRRMNQTLEQIAQTLFKKYFVDDIEPDNLAEGWSNEIFQNHFDLDKGLSYKGRGLSVKGRGIPMHNLNSVFEGGGYKYQGIKYYEGEYKERHKLNPWDIIVTNTEQGHKYLLIGYPAVVPSFYSQGIFTHHIYRIKPKANSYLSNQFLYYLLLSPNIRNQVISCTNGTTVNMLSIIGLQKPIFTLPPKRLIENFSKAIIPFWRQKENLHIQNEKLVEIRDTLLPKLMSGEIEVGELLHKAERTRVPPSAGANAS